MAERAFNVLFVCTNNSVRSPIAEAILNHAGKGRFRAYSAGSDPAAGVDPFVRALLEREGLPTGELRSKSWAEFSEPEAPPLDFVITVCDKAAGEVCPVWPGQPVTAHWDVEDPDVIAGEPARHHAIEAVLRQLSHRIVLFVNLPIAQLDVLSLRHRLDDIGRGDQQAD